MGRFELKYSPDMPLNSFLMDKKVTWGLAGERYLCSVMFVWAGGKIDVVSATFLGIVYELLVFLLICLRQILLEDNSIASKPIFNMLMLQLEDVDGHLARAE